MKTEEKTNKTRQQYSEREFPINAIEREHFGDILKSKDTTPIIRIALENFLNKTVVVAKVRK
jgi:hypothetical protein